MVGLGGKERENVWVPRGDRDGSGRGVSTYHTPSIPKSRGRFATRQIVVAGKTHFSRHQPRERGRRRGKIKKNFERGRKEEEERASWREKERNGGQSVRKTRYMYTLFSFCERGGQKRRKSERLRREDTGRIKIKRWCASE